MVHWFSIKPQTILLPGDIRLEFRKRSTAAPAVLKVSIDGIETYITFHPDGEVRMIQEMPRLTGNGLPATPFTSAG